MKRIMITIIIIAALLTGCGGNNIKDTTPRSIEVYIEQGGNRIEVKDNTAELRRMPFSFIFNFSKPDSIFVSASFSSDTFNNAGAGLQLEELTGFKNAGVDEEPFNKDNLLYISANTPNLWYYTDNSDNSFNLIKKHEKGIICQRDITSVSDVDSGNQVTDISKLKKDSIYLVFLSVDWNEDYTRMIEKSRKLIKIKFII